MTGGVRQALCHLHWVACKEMVLLDSFWISSELRVPPVSRWLIDITWCEVDNKGRLDVPQTQELLPKTSTTSLKAHLVGMGAKQPPQLLESCIVC